MPTKFTKKLWISTRALVFQCIISQSDLIEFWKLPSKRDLKWHLSTYFVSITYFVLVTQLYTSELYISIQSLWRISTNKIFFCIRGFDLYLSRVLQQTLVVSKGQFVYYVRKMTGWVVSENIHFCWRSVLNLCWTCG